MEQQAREAGVLFLDDRYTVPRDGVRDVPLLVDGGPADGVIRVDDGLATLLVVQDDGSLVPVAG